MSGVRCAQISGRRQGGSHGHTGKRSGRIPSGGPRGAAGLAIVNIASVAAFGAPVPKSPGGLALSCLLAIGGLFALGLLIAALAPTANSVNAIGRLALIPLLFFAGLWLPRPLMPAVLLDISNYTPLGAAVEAIQGSVQTGFPPATPLLVLAGYTLVFAYLARRFFRWE